MTLRPATFTTGCHTLISGILVWTLLANSALAGGGPENVAVVVNEDSFASKAVANTFVQLRRIPPDNVISLALGDLPDFEIIDVQVFRERILRPVLESLNKRGLASQIDCVAYSSDIPYAIRIGSDVGDRKPPKVLTQTASINGLTYLYAMVLSEQPVYLSLSTNAYARLPTQFSVSGLEKWTEEQREQYTKATQHLLKKEYEPAMGLLQELVAAQPEFTPGWYNLACSLARLSRGDEAMQALDSAVKAGWRDVDHLRRDEDLASLRERKDFLQLAKRLEDQPVRLRPTLGFRSSVSWDQAGNPVPAGKGVPYMLSTMLSVTSGRGLSIHEALEQLERSAAADGTMPAGTIYLMDNSDVRSRTRKPMFKNTVQLLEQAGVQAKIVEGRLPQQCDDVLGLVAGSAKFDWPASGSKILPGAICEHLTSTGGVMVERGSQTPLTEFLRYGAAASSGTVTEPYAIAAKFPLPYMHVHYARGCNVAEAFYQSVAGPYQLLIVGDPLCAPWAQPPVVQQPEWEQPLKGQLVFKPSASAPEGKTIGRYELFVDGHRSASCGAGASLTLDTPTLADGHHEFRLVAIVADPIQTQGRAIWNTTVDNGGHSIQFDTNGSAKITLDESVTLDAAMADAVRLQLRHQGRVLKDIDESKGRFVVSGTELGMGTTELTVVGFVDGNETPAAFSQAVQVSVARPSPRKAVTVPADAKWKDGVTVRVAGGEPKLVEDTRPADWLKSLGIKSDQPFYVQGHFKVSAEGIYQFQLRSPRDVTILVDDQVLIRSRDDRWKFVPVALHGGMHRLRVEVDGAGPPRLQLRFGGPGSTRIGNRHFRSCEP